jgi:hypothetical protein
MERHKISTAVSADRRLAWSPLTFLPADLQALARGTWFLGEDWKSRPLQSTIRDHSYHGLHATPSGSYVEQGFYAQTAQASFLTTPISGADLVAAQADPADGITLWVLFRRQSLATSVLLGSFLNSSTAYVALALQASSIQALADNGAGTTYAASVADSADADPPSAPWTLAIARFANSANIKVRRYNAALPSGQDSSNGTGSASSDYLTGGSNPLLIGKGTGANTAYGNAQDIAMAGCFRKSISDAQCGDLYDAVVALLAEESTGISIS